MIKFFQNTLGRTSQQQSSEKPFGGRLSEQKPDVSQHLASSPSQRPEHGPRKSALPLKKESSYKSGNSGILKTLPDYLSKTFKKLTFDDQVEPGESRASFFEQATRQSLLQSSASLHLSVRNDKSVVGGYETPVGSGTRPLTGFQRKGLKQVNRTLRVQRTEFTSGPEQPPKRPELAAEKQLARLDRRLEEFSKQNSIEERSSEFTKQRSLLGQSLQTQSSHSGASESNGATAKELRKKSSVPALAHEPAHELAQRKAAHKHGTSYVRSAARQLQPFSEQLEAMQRENEGGALPKRRAEARGKTLKVASGLGARHSLFLIENLERHAPEPVGAGGRAQNEFMASQLFETQQRVLESTERRFSFAGQFGSYRPNPQSGGGSAAREGAQQSLLKLKQLQAQFEEQYRARIREYIRGRQSLQQLIQAADVIKDYDEICDLMVRYIKFCLEAALQRQAHRRKQRSKTKERLAQEELRAEAGVRLEAVPLEFVQRVQGELRQLLGELRLDAGECEDFLREFEENKAACFVEPQSIEIQIGGRQAVREIVLSTFQRIEACADFTFRGTPKNVSEETKVQRFVSNLLRGHMKPVYEQIQDEDIIEMVTLRNFALLKYRAYQAMRGLAKRGAQGGSALSQNAVNIIMERLEAVRCFVVPENHLIDKNYSNQMAMALLRSDEFRKYTLRNFNLALFEEFLDEFLETMLVFQNYQTFVEKWRAQEVLTLDAALLSLFEEYLVQNVPRSVVRPDLYLRDIEYKVLKIRIWTGLQPDPLRLIDNREDFTARVLRDLQETDAEEDQSLRPEVEGSVSALQARKEKERENVLELTQYFLYSALSTHNILSVYDMIYLMEAHALDLLWKQKIHQSILQYLLARSHPHALILQFLSFVRKAHA